METAEQDKMNTILVRFGQLTGMLDYQDFAYFALRIERLYFSYPNGPGDQPFLKPCRYFVSCIGHQRGCVPSGDYTYFVELQYYERLFHYYSYFSGHTCH